MASGGAVHLRSAISSDLCNPPNESELESDIVLTLADIKSIQKQLLHYEKIAMAFLFYENDILCLNTCSKCIENRNYMILDSFVKENNPKNWSMKVLECLFRIKNYYLLNRYGLLENDAKRRFIKTSYISPVRLTLYQICEALSRSDTELLMNTVGSIPREEYLEVFFLKLHDQSDWTKVYNFLSELKNAPGLVNKLDTIRANTFFKTTSSSETGNESAGKTYIPSSLEKNAYPIHDPENVGLCLIINQMNFQAWETRHGSDKDVEALENTMREFNFNVVTRTDQPRSFFGLPFAELIVKSLKKVHSVFFLVILSHGQQGVIFCSDDKPISIEQDILKTLSMLVPLRNLPKVLIIQACQGDKYLLSRKVVTDGDRLLPSTIQVDNVKIDLKEIVGSYISDTFIAMSTVPGFRSFRQTDKGSYFIQMLCHCLRTYCYDTIYDIVTEVIKLVKEEVVKTKLSNNINFAQQPEFRSLLDKKLYLKIRK